MPESFKIIICGTNKFKLEINFSLKLKFIRTAKTAAEISLDGSWILVKLFDEEICELFKCLT